jgi:hypothetical protein
MDDCASECLPNACRSSRSVASRCSRRLDEPAISIDAGEVGLMILQTLVDIRQVDHLRLRSLFFGSKRI